VWQTVPERRTGSSERCTNSAIWISVHWTELYDIRLRLLPVLEAFTQATFKVSYVIFVLRLHCVSYWFTHVTCVSFQIFLTEWTVIPGLKIIAKFAIAVSGIGGLIKQRSTSYTTLLTGMWKQTGYPVTACRSPNWFQELAAGCVNITRECIPGPVFSFPGIGNFQMSFPGFPGARE